MKLLTELKERREKITVAIEEKRQARRAIQDEVNALWSVADELDVAVAAIEASIAALNEEQPNTWTPTVTDAEITVADLSRLETKASPEERAEMEGGGDFIKAICTETCIACGCEINLAVSDDERDPDMGLGEDGWQCGDCARRYAAPTPLIDVPAPVDGEYHPTDDEVTFALESIGVDPTTGEVRPAPTTDLWQQGYNDKLNGFEPSLAEPEYTKGYEARALIEREHSETMERAKFFEGGMMADADRHQSDQRSIVEKIGGLFKREKEDA